MERAEGGSRFWGCGGRNGPSSSSSFSSSEPLHTPVGQHPALWGVLGWVGGGMQPHAAPVRHCGGVGAAISAPDPIMAMRSDILLCSLGAGGGGDTPHNEI